MPHALNDYTHSNWRNENANDSVCYLARLGCEAKSRFSWSAVLTVAGGTSLLGALFAYYFLR